MTLSASSTVIGVIVAITLVASSIAIVLYLLSLKNKENSSDSHNEE